MPGIGSQLLLPERIRSYDLTAEKIFESVFDQLKGSPTRIDKYKCYKRSNGERGEFSFSEQAVIIDNNGKHCLVSFAINNRVVRWKPYKSYVAVVPVYLSEDEVLDDNGGRIKDNLGTGYYFGRSLLFTESDGTLKTCGNELFGKVDYKELKLRIRMFDSEMSLESGSVWPQGVPRTYSPTLQAFINMAITAAINSN